MLLAEGGDGWCDLVVVPVVDVLVVAVAAGEQHDPELASEVDLGGGRVSISSDMLGRRRQGNALALPSE